MEFGRDVFVFKRFAVTSLRQRMFTVPAETWYLFWPTAMFVYIMLLVLCGTYWTIAVGYSFEKLNTTKYYSETSQNSTHNNEFVGCLFSYLLVGFRNLKNLNKCACVSKDYYDQIWSWTYISWHLIPITASTLKLICPGVITLAKAVKKIISVFFHKNKNM